MPSFTKKERRMQVSAFLAIFKADFGCFRPVSAVSAILAAGRYDPIWPIRLDFGRISPVWCESKPIRHELSHIGANRAESARIREKKKKKKKTQTQSNARATASDVGAAPLVPVRAFQLIADLRIARDKLFFRVILLNIFGVISNNTLSFCLYK